MTEITSLQLVAGIAKHVTVVDHNNADAPLPPGSVSWNVLGGFSDVAFITADATGFNFLISSPGSGTVQAVYSSAGVHVPGPALAVTITAAVLPAYTSP